MPGLSLRAWPKTVSQIAMAVDVGVVEKGVTGFIGGGDGAAAVGHASHR